MRVIGALLVLCLAASPARAQSALVFEGESYRKAFESFRNPTDLFIEHTRPGETVETWTKLLTAHWFPKDQSEPSDATNRLAILAKQRYPRADPQLSENANTREAIVSFVAATPDGKLFEINVFKYAPAGRGKGLVAIGYAFRVNAAGGMSEAATSERARAFEAIKTFDMDEVRKAFPQS